MVACHSQQNKHTQRPWDISCSFL